MRLLLDETVLIELVGERQPYCACWNKLAALQLTRAAELWVPADAYGVLKRALDNELPAREVSSALAATLDFIEVCSVAADDVRRALEDEDYDEALLDACARKIKADFIITRRAPFSASARVCTPEGFFDELERAGTVFELVDL